MDISLPHDVIALRSRPPRIVSGLSENVPTYAVDYGTDISSKIKAASRKNLVMDEISSTSDCAPLKSAVQVGGGNNARSHTPLATTSSVSSVSPSSSPRALNVNLSGGFNNNINSASSGSTVNHLMQSSLDGRSSRGIFQV